MGAFFPGKYEPPSQYGRDPEYDPDLSPQHPVNKEAAAKEGLVYRDGSYRDADGCQIRDKFGQRY